MARSTAIGWGNFLLIRRCTLHMPSINLFMYNMPLPSEHLVFCVGRVARRKLRVVDRLSTASVHGRDLKPSWTYPRNDSLTQRRGRKKSSMGAIKFDKPVCRGRTQRQGIRYFVCRYNANLFNICNDGRLKVTRRKRKLGLKCLKHNAYAFFFTETLNHW